MKKLLITAFTAVSTMGSLSAAPLTNALETTDVNTVEVGHNDVDGYYFYGGSTDHLVASSAPAFASVSLVSGSYGDYPGNSAYSTITVDGGVSLFTGITSINGVQPVAGTPTTYYDIATITLNSSVPSLFTVGLLTGNTDTVGNNALYEVELNDDPTTLLQINTSASSSTKSNDFLNFTASGLVSGDTLTILAGNNPNLTQNSLGIDGVVLSSAAAPEPGTYALLALGLAALVLKLRTRRMVEPVTRDWTT